MTVTQLRHEPGSAFARADGTSGASGTWRRWRVPLILIALILIGGTVVALLTPAPRVVGYLDPASASPAGTHALEDILKARGHEFISTYDPASALAAAGKGSGRATLVITSPDLLTAGQKTRLSLTPADIVLVEPGPSALAAFAPDVSVAGYPVTAGPQQPGCRLSAARLAGDADVGWISYSMLAAPAGAVGCYPADGRPTLVRYNVGDQAITILGSGAPLANQFLARHGNAALALNLLSTSQRIVWLTPQPSLTAGAGPPGGARSLTFPLGVRLVLLQLGIAVLLAALWRARRLGPLVTEQLPVVVRASETVEGHARLYQARRARGRAAAAMREGMRARVLPALGLARDAPQDSVIDALATRSAMSQQAIAAIMFGPPPTRDAELMALVRNLDELEREVRSQ